MTDKEIVATFKQIADTLESIVNQQNMIIDSLDTQGEAIKILFEESIAKDKELLTSLDGQIEDFLKEALKK